MGIEDYWRGYIYREVVKHIKFSMHSKSIKTSLMMTPEVLPVMEIDPRVEMHSKCSANIDFQSNE